MSPRYADQCPECYCTNIEGEGVEVEETTATQGCTCNECGAEWSNVYELTGFTLHRSAAEVKEDRACAAADHARDVAKDRRAEL